MITWHDIDSFPLGTRHARFYFREAQSSAPHQSVLAFSFASLVPCMLEPMHSRHL